MQSKTKKTWAKPTLTIFSVSANTLQGLNPGDDGDGPGTAFS